MLVAAAAPGQPSAPLLALVGSLDSLNAEADASSRSALERSPASVIQPLSPEASAALKDAEKHFQAGKAFAIEGQAAPARTEFDAAIDALMKVGEDVADRSQVEKRFEEMIRLIHRYDVERMGSGESPQNPVFVPSPLPEILDMTFPMDPSLKGLAVEQVRAAKSQLPLVVNDAVLTYINFFSSPRGSKILMYGLKRSGRYRPMISRILDEEGVPQELIHLAQAESAFAPRAVSRKAACGMWQFVQWRGREYGLEQDAIKDERLDPEKATRAAARHLRDLYDQFGDWYLAMAAYNCGPGCVDRAVQRTGYADYWEQRSRGALPKETSNYVPAILAMTIMTKNLGAYGLQPPEQDPEMEYDTITVPVKTSLSLIADASDRPVSDLSDLNPAYLRGVAPEGAAVRVPKGSAQPVLAALETIPAEKRTAWRIHKVERGETLMAIAKRYSIPANSILAANDGIDNAFFASAESGERLLIPAAEQKVAPRTVSRTKSGTTRSSASTAARRTTTPAKAVSRTTKPTTKLAKATPRQGSLNRQ